MNENQYRIWRSPYSRFGGLNSLRPDDTTDETVTAVDCYTDDVLREIAENGFNAIWLHSVLANITHLTFSRSSGNMRNCISGIFRL